jgi:hypothetical protein
MVKKHRSIKSIMGYYTSRHQRDLLHEFIGGTVVTRARFRCSSRIGANYSFMVGGFLTCRTSDIDCLIKRGLLEGATDDVSSIETTPRGEETVKIYDSLIRTGE